MYSIWSAGKLSKKRKLLFYLCGRKVVLVVADDGAFTVTDDVVAVLFVEVDGEVAAVGVEDHPGLRAERDVVEDLLKDVVVPPVAHDAGARPVLPLLRLRYLGVSDAPVPDHQEKIKLLDGEFLADAVQPVPQPAAFGAAVRQLVGGGVFFKRHPFDGPLLPRLQPGEVLLLLALLAAGGAPLGVMVQAGDVSTAVHAASQDRRHRGRFHRVPLYAYHKEFPAGINLSTSPYKTERKSIASNSGLLRQPTYCGSSPRNAADSTKLENRSTNRTNGPPSMTA